MKKFYDIEKHGITQSLLMEWMSCRQKCAHKLQGWGVRRVNPDALWFGDMVHWLLEQWYSGKDPEVGQWISLQRVQCRKDATAFDPGRATQDQNNLIAVGDVLFEEYKEQWKVMDKRIAWIELESEFTVVVPVCTRQHGTLNIPLRGKRDGVFTWVKQARKYTQSSVTKSPGALARAQRWTFETKTAAQILEPKKMRTLEFDFQNLFYLTCTELESKKRCYGTLYNIIRKPQTYQRKSENPESYVARMRENIAADREHFFLRYECSYTVKQLTAFKAQLRAAIEEFTEWVLSDFSNTFRNTSVCNAFSGCQYINACAHGDIATSGMYERISRVHPELAKDK